MSGWWLTYPSEKKKKTNKVSWDDDIPNIWKEHVPNHQPVSVILVVNILYFSIYWFCAFTSKNSGLIQLKAIMKLTDFLRRIKV